MYPKLRFKEFDDAWEQRKLEDMASFSKGSGYSKSDLIDSGTPLILYGRLYTKYETVITEVDTYAEEKKSSVFSKGGEVIVPASGETAEDISVASVVEKSEVLLGGDLNVITPSEVLESMFLALNITYGKAHKDMSKLAQGKSVVHLHNADLKTIVLQYPSILEQRKICEFFKSLDNLITLHQRQCEALKKQKRFFLQNMFPKEGESEPRIRFNGFTEPWEQRKLGELVNFLDTQRKPLEESKRKKGPYPYYGASGIVDYVSDYIFDRELILLSEDGANITDRNYPVCFLASGKYWVNNHAHVLECKAENDNNFICISLERKDFKKFNTGMAMPKLNKETCKIIPVSCTSLEEQTKIGNFFRELETNITLHQRQYEQLVSLKKYLLSKMFI